MNTYDQNKNVKREMNNYCFLAFYFVSILCKTPLLRKIKQSNMQCNLKSNQFLPKNFHKPFFYKKTQYKIAIQITQKCHKDEIRFPPKCFETKPKCCSSTIQTDQLRIRYTYCIKSVGDYRVNLRIQFECGKMRTRKTPNTDTFHTRTRSKKVSY